MTSGGFFQPLMFWDSVNNWSLIIIISSVMVERGKDSLHMSDVLSSLHHVHIDLTFNRFFVFEDLQTPRHFSLHLRAGPFSLVSLAVTSGRSLEKILQSHT